MILQFCHLELVEEYIDNQIIEKLRQASILFRHSFLISK